MKVLIIGLGSIGRKHIKALRRLTKNVKVFALRSEPVSSEIEGVVNIFDLNELKEEIDFTIVSNPTYRHKETIEDLISNFDSPIFLEKPPFMNLSGAEEIIDKIKKREIITYTAFNLRFHPVISFLKGYLPSKRVIECNIYCGSYLPDWRPDQDYRLNYSASKEKGGGVQLDLIHELDYMKWLFGDPNSSTVTLKKNSDLEINSIDYAHYLNHYDTFVVSVTLNYYRRDRKRNIEILTTDGTITADLLTNKVSLNNKIIFESDSSIEDTYMLQLEYFIDAIRNKKACMNSLRESLSTLKLAIGNA